MTRKATAPKGTRQFLDALQTTSYRDWATAIRELREHLDTRAQAEITEPDLLMILRANLWWRHHPGFADVRATCEAAMPVLLAHMAKLGDTGKQVGTFLATYLDDGRNDRQCGEIEISIAAKRWAAKLKGSEGKTLRALSKLMNDIYGTKHAAYWVLRHVGWQQVAAIGRLIHGMPPSDQAFLLHALDGSLQKPGVKKFYKDFIAKTLYPHLVTEARRYAMMQ